jgi:type I restriction enzyme S subunit
MVALGELMATRVPSLDPAKFPDEEFELWSIPAFDAGAPERTAGRQIGSAKKIVRPNDVLISRIVPHIRRAWIVDAPKENRRQIASGEWIVFRSDRIHPAYLRHVLVGDAFHNQFMETVSGMGGSLLRARPEAVKLIKIPLPPLPEQRRIAAILDQADALRRLRRDSLARLGDLGQAIFYEMFGDPISNPKRWDKVALSECVAAPDDIRCGPFGTQLLKNEFQDEGVPLWGIKQVNKGFAIPTHEFVSCRKAKELANYSIVSGDIVMTRKGTIGNCSVYPDGFPLGIMHSDLLRVRVDRRKCDPEFLSDQLHFSRDVQHQIALISGGAIMQGINVGKLKAIRVLCPPKPLQDEYMERVRAVGSRRREAIQHQAGMEKLFASLQHRAFRGEL